MELSSLQDVPGIRGAIYRTRQLKARADYALHNSFYFARIQKQKGEKRTSIAQVVVGRNDDYMPDFLQRLIATIEWNARYLVDEVVFVEWNPVVGRDYLATSLAKRFKFLRAYIVPPEIHGAICDNPNLQLMEFHAKNVGIRRAKSPWVIATNADAAFGPDITHQVQNADLRPDNVWTAQRVDIPWQVGRSSSIKFSDLMRYRRVIPYKELGTGEFVLASKDLWNKARGYDESLNRHRIDCDMIGTAQMLAHGATIKKAGVVFHLAHPTSCTEGGVRPHHGEYAGFGNVPYKNENTWGLGGYREVPVAERIWIIDPNSNARVEG